jgi:hypothetical protein
MVLAQGQGITSGAGRVPESQDRAEHLMERDREHAMDQANLAFIADPYSG